MNILLIYPKFPETFWHLMLWTLMRKPRLLPLAVTLAIQGYHYRRICELYIF